MRAVIAIVANLGVICCAYAAMTVPAWRNVVERECAEAVEYFISPETKHLEYRQIGDEKEYMIGEYKRKEGL